MAKRGQQTASVELHPLVFVETAGARKKRLEPVGVFFDGPRAAALGEFEEGRPEPQLQKLLEAPLGRRAFILLELDEPELGNVLQIVGGHPHALLRHGALLAEIGLAPIYEQQRIRLAVKSGKIQFLEPGRSIGMVLAVLVATRRGGLGSFLLEARHIGGEGLQHLDDVGEAGFTVTHGWMHRTRRSR